MGSGDPSGHEAQSGGRVTSRDLAPVTPATDYSPPSPTPCIQDDHEFVLRAIGMGLLHRYPAFYSPRNLIIPRSGSPLGLLRGWSLGKCRH